MNALHRRPGFTLIELLLVIAIIAVLLGLILCAVQSVRSTAEKIGCTNNLHQIGIAFAGYHNVHQVFPPGVSVDEGTPSLSYLNWQARLLPFLERADLWEQSMRAYDQTMYFSLSPHPGNIVVPVFNCPADSRTITAPIYDGRSMALTSYLGVEGINLNRFNGMLFLDSKVRLADVTDGTSSTLFVGERPASADLRFGWWYAGVGQFLTGSLDSCLGVREILHTPLAPDCPDGPYSYKPGKLTILCDAFHFWSLHPGGAHFLFVDGSVRFLGYSVDPLMPALATRAGGESVSLPD